MSMGPPPGTAKSKAEERRKLGANSRSASRPLLSARRGRPPSARGNTPGRLKQKINASRIAVEVVLPNQTVELQLSAGESVHNALHDALGIGGELVVSFNGKSIPDDGSTLTDHDLKEGGQLNVTGGGRKLKQQQALHGHEHWIFCMVVLRNGMLASGSADKTIRIWDLNKSKCIKVLSGHEDAVAGIAELRSGQIVSCSYDKTIRLWDMGSGNGKCTRVLEGHEGAVYTVVPLNDGRLASGSEDATMRIWSKGCLTAGRKRNEGDEKPLVLSGHDAAVTAVTQLPGGFIATCSDDCTVRLWDLNVKSGKLKKKLTDREDPVMNVTVLADGRLAMCGANSTISLLANDAKSACVLEGHKGPVSRLVQLTEDMAVSCSFDQTLRLWNLETGVCIDCIEGHQGWVYSVVELPEGRLASGGTDMVLRVWG